MSISQFFAFLAEDFGAFEADDVACTGVPASFNADFGFLGVFSVP